MTADTKLAILAGAALMGGILLAGHYAAEEDAALEAEQRAVAYVRQPTEDELAMLARYQRERNAEQARRDRAEMEERIRR